MVLIKGIKLGLYIYILNFCFALFGLWKGGTCSVNEKKDNSIWSNDFSVYIIVTYFFFNVSDISFQIFPFSSIIQKCIHLRVNNVILDIAFVKSVFLIFILKSFLPNMLYRAMQNYNSWSNFPLLYTCKYYK